MPKLTDTQLIILAAAAKRDDGSILPLPKKLRLEPEAAAGIFKTLITRQLAGERPATASETSWRETGDGQRVILAITKAGLRSASLDLGDRYKKTETYDAAEFYAPDDEQPGFEEDNNEPF